MDNAATSFPKPPGVVEAFVHYHTHLGASAGRGAYAEAIDTANALTRCRGQLNRFIHGTSDKHIVFTLNCSDALNLAIKGLIDPTGSKPQHAICTAIDHNSILRPLHALRDRGLISLTVVPVDPQTGIVDVDDLRRALRPDTKLIAITHASNVTGSVQPVRAIGQLARSAAVPFIVDAAQSIGHVPIDVQLDYIDLLAAPGHKALLGPLGTGFLYLRPGMEKLVRTLKEGGTGSVSETPFHPDFMPDKYESGSHNAPGILALSAALDWIEQQTPEKLFKHESDLVRTFIDGCLSIDNLTYYGPQGVKDRIGVFSVSIPGLSPHELAAILESNYGILTRPGFHCAPFAHETIGTAPLGGSTRLSFGPFLTPQDVKYATDALAEIAAEYEPATPAAK
jgi:cysteine desulfurase family protein